MDARHTGIHASHGIVERHNALYDHGHFESLDQFAQLRHALGPGIYVDGKPCGAGGLDLGQPLQDDFVGTRLAVIERLALETRDHRQVPLHVLDGVGEIVAHRAHRPASHHARSSPEQATPSQTGQTRHQGCFSSLNSKWYDHAAKGVNVD
jgi:hypothetical protein